MKYIDNESKVRMVQRSKNRWELQTSKGYPLQTDITVSSKKEAEDFVKRYLTSFNCWTYEIIPLEEK